MTDGPGPQRELKLEMSNPVANVYLTAINEALDEAADGVPEAQLRQQVPKWFLRALVAAGVYDRTKEPQANGRGGEWWVWRNKGLVSDAIVLGDRTASNALAGGGRNWAT